VAETKNLLLRLDPELAEQLQAVAAVEGRPMSEVVREAIRSLVEARRQDDAFQDRLRQIAKQQRRALRSLKGLDDG
jgi:predicted transcriptional regulator